MPNISARTEEVITSCSVISVLYNKKGMKGMKKAFNEKSPIDKW
jgi:hypothetical protein